MKKRYKVNKRKSKSIFKRTVAKTKRINNNPNPMRGGIRL